MASNDLSSLSPVSDGDYGDNQLVDADRSGQ